MADRFIKLYEKMLQWGWYKNTNVKVLFIHLLLRANYKPMIFEGHTIERGQLVTSLDSLAAELGLTRKQIRGSLEHLISTGEVASSTFPRYRVITVLNYDEYQAKGSLEGRQTAGETAGKGQSEGRLGAGSGQAQGSLRATSIEYIEQKEDIEQIEQIESSSPVAGFDDFWKIYPKKISKQDAMKAWKVLKPNAETQAKIMSSLQQWITSDQWQRENGQYIPYPATWIRKRRWEDEPEAAKQPAPAPVPRPQQKMIPARDFEQRDYSSVNDDIMNDLAAEMARFKLTGEVEV